MTTHSLPVILAMPAKRPEGKVHVAVPLARVGLADNAAVTLCGTRMNAWVEPPTDPDAWVQRCGRCFPFFALAGF